MRRFARLFEQLDASTGTLDKVAALRRYYDETALSAPADAAWATYFLAGGKPRQVVPTALLRGIACKRAGIDDWLFDECYQAVGDLAETIAHVLPPGRDQTHAGLADWVENTLLPLRVLPPEEQAARVLSAWEALDAAGRFLSVKLIGGGFRVGVSKLLVQRALAEHAGLDAKLMAQRLMGWTDARATPSAARFAALLSHDQSAGAVSGQPYPFFLAHALQVDAATLDQTLGDPRDWLVEWKYDGIRAQAVKRAGQVWLWSRGEELVTERFPEIVAKMQPLPDGTVLDGEVLVWPEGQGAPSPFHLLQQRIGRKLLSKKVLADAPVVFLAYDLLERAGEDQRNVPQVLRRARLVALLQDSGIKVSPQVDAADWPAYIALRQTARERAVEGFMLKQLEGHYGQGRTRADGTWWKWKIDPLSVDAVLIYAQAGHGRRASVYTDYTFAVWSRPPADEAEAQAVIDAIARREPAADGALQLLPFAKAYSGLSDEEFKRVDRTIRADTLEKFGPVRSVKPSLVFEVGFEGINRSPRHKSGIAVRFPRMLRIRDDKPIWQADSLQTLVDLIG